MSISLGIWRRESGNRVASAWSILRSLIGAPGADVQRLCSHCEFPAHPSALAEAVAANPLMRNSAGEISAPDAPGLGSEVDIEALRPYLLDAEIQVGGRVWATRLNERKGFKKAAVAAARKIAVIMHCIWRNDAVFDPNMEGVA
ncbi:hypothetical protein [Boseongicola aestuarii]|uniref:Enolase C-terminal domain-containing protein n=1 Tax=Boseongicola aestuarii TaxID=1470561 RepID=A0A238J2X3_9RHOB|nr:hypothetical protein [Boseongicola aestuarii]SMX25048.1 hypothetical protein BOA8489_03182 [Boseongicola aestuarii]